VSIHPAPIDTDRGARGLAILACQGRLEDGDDVTVLAWIYGGDIVRAAQRRVRDRTAAQ